MRLRVDRLLGRRGHVTVLAYHEVPDQAAFASQLEYLSTRFTPVSLEDVHGHLEHGSRLPAHAALVTFDDGHRSVVENGLPVLESFGWSGVMFVVAGLVDTAEPFWWDEVVELVEQRRATGSQPRGGEGDPAEEVRRLKSLPDSERRREIEALRRSAGRPVTSRQLTSWELRDAAHRGLAIGSHTLSHPILTRCDDRTLRDELVSAHERLGEVLDTPVTAFAYPNGDVDRRAKPILTSLGYRSAFAFDHRLAKVPLADGLAISRLRVSANASVPHLATILSGVQPALLRARETARHMLAGARR